MTNFRNNTIFKIKAVLVIFAFITTLSIPPHHSYAQAVLTPKVIETLNLPQPGNMVALSQPYIPVYLRGMTINPNNPFQFDFIVDSGDSNLQGIEMKQESERLVRYFLASLTVPESNVWVNLSPFESNRIIPNDFGKTEMGKDMLAQDYLLKQITASLIYPEDNMGEEFWNRVYRKALDQYGTTDIPIETFHKVWIVPQRANIYEHDNTVIVLDTHLKVLLEKDYLAQNNSSSDSLNSNTNPKKVNEDEVSLSIVKDLILPEIEKEVNEGKNFVMLRQIFHSMILATWYKNKLKLSPLNNFYTNQSKIFGINNEDEDIKQKIYDQYLAAFKKGVFDFIKEDYDVTTQQVIPRKYFSGGVEGRIDQENIISVSREMITDKAILAKGHYEVHSVSMSPVFENIKRILTRLVRIRFNNNFNGYFDYIESQQNSQDRPFVNQVITLLNKVGVSDLDMANRILLVDEKEKRLVGDNGDRLGGLIVKHKGQLKIVFPRSRMLNLTRETFEDLLHELIEVKLLEEYGLGFDEAHQEALAITQSVIESAGFDGSSEIEAVKNQIDQIFLQREAKGFSEELQSANDGIIGAMHGINTNIAEVIDPVNVGFGDERFDGLVDKKRTLISGNLLDVQERPEITDEIKSILNHMIPIVFGSRVMLSMEGMIAMDRLNKHFGKDRLIEELANVVSLADFKFQSTEIGLFEKSKLANDAKRKLSISRVLWDLLQKSRMLYASTPFGVFEQDKVFASAYHDVTNDFADQVEGVVYFAQLPNRQLHYNTKEMAVIALHEIIHLLFRALDLPMEGVHDLATGMHQAMSAHLFSKSRAVDDKFKRIKIKVLAGESFDLPEVGVQRVGSDKIQIVQGDITQSDAEVIVNGSQPELRIGIGVGRAIIMAGGGIIEEEMREYVEDNGPVDLGDAIVTSAGNLEQKHVIHVAVSDQNLTPSVSVLRRATESVLRKADELGVRSVAFPAFGAGTLGFTFEESANVMLEVIEEYFVSHPDSSLERVVISLLDEVGFQAFKQVWDGEERNEGKILIGVHELLPGDRIPLDDDKIGVVLKVSDDLTAQSGHVDVLILPNLRSDDEGELRGREIQISASPDVSFELMPPDNNANFDFNFGDKVQVDREGEILTGTIVYAASGSFHVVFPDVVNDRSRDPYYGGHALAVHYENPSLRKVDAGVAWPERGRRQFAITHLDAEFSSQTPKYKLEYALKRWIRVKTDQAREEGIDQILVQSLSELEGGEFRSWPFEILEPYLVNDTYNLNVVLNILRDKRVKQILRDNYGIEFSQEGPLDLNEVIKVHPETKIDFDPTIVLAEGSKEDNKSLIEVLSDFGSYPDMSDVDKLYYFSFNNAKDVKKRLGYEYIDALELARTVALSPMSSMIPIDQLRIGQRIGMYERLYQMYYGRTEMLFERLGLGVEYAQYFNNEDAFWDSDETFLAIYQKLKQASTQRVEQGDASNQGDNAMISNKRDLGGIDMSPQWLNFKIDSQAITNFQINPSYLESFNIDGLSPTIINVTPLPNLKPILGIQ